MGVVSYKFTMKVYDTTLQEDVLDLGPKAFFFILADSVTPETAPWYNEDNDFLVDRISPYDDALFLGGPFPAGEGTPAVEKAPQVMPLATPVIIPSEYITNHHKMRYYTEEEGRFLESRTNLGSGYGTGQCQGYVNGVAVNSMYVPMTFSRPINDASTNSLSWVVFVGDSIENASSAYVATITPTTTVQMAKEIVQFSGGSTSQLSLLKDFFSTLTPWVEPTDPYSQGGESDTGGGTGTFDGTSVDVDFTTLPTLSAVNTGFISLYNPTLAQLQSLANYMWSDLFDLDTLKKLFGDPMQTILGLSIVPGPVPSAGAQEVKVGNISTGVSMTKAASQYIDVDCGTLNVEEFWGAYLDYEPYTKAEIYLPYIGTHQIAVDDIMGKAVHIKYHIDILSGACAAEIKCGGSVLYTFIGSVAVSIPITGRDWTNVINGVLSVAGAIGSMVATGGATAPAVAGEIASAAVNSLKPSVEKSGSVSGGGGLMAGKTPVLILTRPRQALPASQNEFTGYPAFITRSLGAVSGYTEVHKIRLGGISATDVELSEIERLLKGGVIL